MKRIIYITQSNGGVARYLQMIFKYINKEKYEHILIYSNQFKKEEKDFKWIVDKVEFVNSDKKIKVIFNGIDIERYEQKLLDEDNYRDELNIPKEAIVVGMVGRLSKQKAPDVFIKCAAIIKKKGLSH